MENLIRKATRKQAKLRLGISAPSGAGKTYSALLLAFGLGGKVGMIDTEHGSGDLYAHLGEYDIINIEAPYTVAKYLAAIKAFERAGYSTIIIDSLSHAWSGEGGLLDKQGKIADSGKGNSYTAWRTITPEHNAIVESMLSSPCHIIAAMRSKTEYVIEKNSNGKDSPRKVGLAPIQRDGMEYEFTIMLDIDMQHVASTSKDRTGLFDGQFFKISKETGEKLVNWLDSGVAVQQTINHEDAEKLLSLLIDVGLSENKFCAAYGINEIRYLPFDKLQDATARIAEFALKKKQKKVDPPTPTLAPIAAEMPEGKGWGSPGIGTEDRPYTSVLLGDDRQIKEIVNE